MKHMGLAAALFLAVLAPAPAEELSAVGAEDRLIVAFPTGTTTAERQQVVLSHGLKFLREIPELGFVLAQADPGKSPQALASLKGDARVLDVQPDIWRKWIEAAPASLQDIPLPTLESVRESLPAFRPGAARADFLRPYQAQEGEAQWGVRRVNAPAAWPTNQGSGVKVAIIDTGIDAEHPDLKGRVAGGYNALDKDKPWADDHFHGTHVAGIVAANLNGEGVVGVAPKASLYAVKVLSKDGAGSLFTIMDGIMWSARNGMQVANMSLGAPQKIPFLDTAIRAAHGAGVTQVAAAGNDGKAVNWPAAFPECIAVSALDEADGIASFSSRGPEIAFIAPGVKVPSTVTGGGIKAYSGTSMATPHVAGLAALAAARGAQGPIAVRSALRSAAESLPALAPAEQGAGIVNAANLAR